MTTQVPNVATLVQEQGECFALDSDKRSVDMVAITGNRIERMFGDVILEIDGISLKRFKKNSVILRDHDHTQPIGKALSVKRVKDDNPRLEIGLRISDKSDIARETFGLMEDGVLTAGSIGFNIDEHEFVDSGETAIVNGVEQKGPFFHFTKTTLNEFSIVAVGADPDALSFSNEDEFTFKPNSLKKETEMSEEKEMVEELGVEFCEDIATVEELAEEYPELVAQLKADASNAGIELYKEAEKERYSAVVEAGEFRDYAMSLYHDGKSKEEIEISIEAFKAGQVAGAASVKVEDAPEFAATDDVKLEKEENVELSLEDQCVELYKKESVQDAFHSVGSFTAFVKRHGFDAVEDII